MRGRPEQMPNVCGSDNGAAGALRSYTIVVPVVHYRVGPGAAAIESAFAEHLRSLLFSLRSHVDRLEVVAPDLPQSHPSYNPAALQVLSETNDRIAFTSAYCASLGRLRFFAHFPRLVARLWSAVGRSAFVHAGPSLLLRPFECIALLIGFLRGRRTIYVVDIDHRESPRMYFATGQWTRGVYWRAKYIHGTWMSMQHTIARVICSVLLLKGRALVRDFGQGRPHVHFILDCAHSASLIASEDQQDHRWRRMVDPQQRLRLCYFGRLVDYKGVDRMIEALAMAREQGALASLDIYGYGDSEPSLRQLAQSLRIEQYVRFHGVLAYGSELFSALKSCDALLAAPLHEDTPRSAIDAQALGMGVIAFDTYYYRELAELGAGVATVPWPDLRALAGAIVELDRNRAALVELGKRGIAFARANTQEVWLERRADWTLGRHSNAGPPPIPT